MAFRVLPFTVDDKFELMGTGRNGGNDGPGAGTFVKHLDGFPVVPVAGKLNIVFGTVGEDKLRFDAFRNGGFSRKSWQVGMCG